MQYGTNEEISKATQQAGNATKAVAKKAVKEAAKTASKAGGPVGVAISAGIEVADRLGLFKILAGLLCIIILFPIIMAVNGIGLGFDVMTHIDNFLHPGSEFEVEENLETSDVEAEDRKYATVIVEQMLYEHERIDKVIKNLTKQKGIDFDNSIIIDNTYIPTLSGGSGSGSAAAAADWAIKICDDDSYTRKDYDKGIHCPICRPELNETKGWQCMGFVQAAYIHGGNMTEVASRMPDNNGGMVDNAEGDRLYQSMDLSEWKENNGPNWELYKLGDNITHDQLLKGDCLMFYSGGVYRHTAIYVGDGKLADSKGYLGGPDDISVSEFNGNYGFDETLVIRYTGDSNVSASGAGTTINPEDFVTKKVKIGQATSDENGNVRGGKAGDQRNGKEVATANLGSGWKTVYRVKDESARLKIANAARQGCENDKIGYDQEHPDRGSLYEEASKNGWDLSKISKACETSCTGFATTCLRAGGVSRNVAPKYAYSSDAPSDKLIDNLLKKSSSIQAIKWKESTPLYPGDILCKDGHTAVVISSPNKLNIASLSTSSSGSGTSIQSGGTSHSREDVINGACAWAEAIAADDSFHYGACNEHRDGDFPVPKVNANKSMCSHHNGCFFCKTNSGKSKYIVDVEKTYCCNPFVHAAYAHGGGEPKMLKKCKSGSSYDWNTYPKHPEIFKSMGDLPVNKLEKGDVLCSNNHVMLYVGGGKVAEAGGRDDNVKGSKSWKNSIRVDKVSAGSYNAVYRYIGKGGGKMEVPAGTGSGNVASFTPCDSLTILDTIDQDTGKRYQIGYPSGTDSNCAQSFAYANGQYAVTFVDSDHPPAYIQTYDEEGNKKEVTREDSVQHGNGACSTPDGNYLVAGALVDGCREIGQEFTVNGNISHIGAKMLPSSASAIAYDKDTKKFIISIGSSMKVYNETLSSMERSISRDMHGQYFQDIGAGGGYIFACHTKEKGRENSGMNYVDIYSEETGDYCGTYKVPYGELESADVVNGELVLLVHILGYKNYIHRTGVMVSEGQGSEQYDDTITRDIAAAIAAFSTYESEILPTSFDSLEYVQSPLGLFLFQLKEAFRRDPDLEKTLKDIISRNKGFDIKEGGYTPGLLNITWSNVVENENGKKTAIIEINHQDGEGLAKFFMMDPDNKYMTENSKKGLFGSRAEGENYEIGDTTIASAIETNTDTHLALLYDNINGQMAQKSVLCLPIKTLFTKLELSKKFEEDLTGIECEPKSGTKVYSCERGDVLQVVEGDKKLGNYVVIKGYYKIIYAHMKTINVKPGDMVPRNTKIGTSTKKFRLEVYDEDIAVDPEPLFVKKVCFGKDFTSSSNSASSSSAGGGGNSSIAEAAVSIAYEKRDQAIGNDGTDFYRKLKPQIIPEDGKSLYRSCDRVVCTAVRWSGSDDSFPAGNCTKQYNHMTGEGKSKWQLVTGINSESDLQPGDILNNPDEHTIVYVGNEEVKKKYPSSDANLVMGSLNNDDYSKARSAACQHDEIIGCGDHIRLKYDGRNYYVFRNTQQESSSRYSGIESQHKSTSGNNTTAGAVAWALKIAADNEFAYGPKGPSGGSGYANMCGCYYCGTNDKKVKKSGGEKRYYKTYMCQSFVTAAYAHGGNEPEMLAMCKKGKNVIRVTGQEYKNFKIIGKAKNLSLNDLKPGDILCSWDSHAAIYIGNGDTVDARSSSKSPWGANTIAVRKGEAKTWLKNAKSKSNKNYVLRYTGPSTSSQYSENTVRSKNNGDTGSSVKTESGKKGTYQKYALSLFSKYGWSNSELSPLIKLWNKESGWNPNAHNGSSGAHGIPQALPASKMASEGSDYMTNYKTQIRWGLKYIKGRYGTPSKAWKHFQNNNWY